MSHQEPTVGPSFVYKIYLQLWIEKQRRVVSKRHKSAFGEWVYTFGSPSFREGYKTALKDVEKWLYSR